MCSQSRIEKGPSEVGWLAPFLYESPDSTLCCDEDENLNTVESFTSYLQAI